MPRSVNRLVADRNSLTVETTPEANQFRLRIRRLGGQPSESLCVLQLTALPTLAIPEQPKALATRREAEVDWLDGAFRHSRFSAHPYRRSLPSPSARSLS